MTEQQTDFPGLEEYPLRPPEEYRVDDGEIQFQIQEEYIPVAPPPEQVSAYIEEGTRNFQYNTPLPPEIQSLLEHDQVSDAFQRGYALSIPYTVAFIDSSPPDTPLEIGVNSKISDEEVKRLTPPVKDADHGAVFKINLQWTVKTPQEYVLLCLPIPFTGDDAYEVFPQLIDPLPGQVRLSCDILVHEPGVALRVGEPLLQVIPIELPATELDATIEMP